MKKIIVPITTIIIVLAAAVMPARADSTFAVTSGKNSFWQTAAITEGTGGTTVTVNENSKNQTWRGFHGCFNEAGWDALKVLSQDKIDQAMKLLFDRKNGIGFQMGRIPIGASDYALSRYTLDDASSDDLTMSKFSIERDKGCLIKFIKAAQAVKPDLKFWASPWTPPPWMKKSGSAFDPAGFDGGVMRNEANVLKAHALYFSKFITAYEAEGIPISAVCPQNEPGYTRSYPTCGWGPYNYDDGKNTKGDKTDPEFLSTFVADHLYPQLQTDHPKTEVWFGTLSNANTAPSYWNGMKTKAGTNAKTMIKGLGLQWNNEVLVKENTNAGYFVFCSEHQCGNYYWKTKITSIDQADSTNFFATQAPNNFAYGLESWRLFKTWILDGAQAYSAWNMVLDTKGINLNTALEWPQNALLVVDRSAKTLTATPYYYVMRHIAQYVDSGAVRLGTTGGEALAFKNPNASTVVIAYNSGSSAAQTTIAVGGKNYKLSIPGPGWATLVANWTTSVEPDQARGSNAGNVNDLKVTSKETGYSVALPSGKAGRIDLMTVSGRVLESRAIPQGCNSILLPRQASHAGLLLVRAIYGSEVKTARLLAY
jgi:glucosylceramidase